MIIHWAKNQHQVRVLLDTGCSVPLISQELAEKLQLPLLKHEHAFAMENYTGQAVEGAGQFYTRPMFLQHRKHFTRESFEVSPMEKEVDIFLPFWWIAKHPPQGAWDSVELRFSTPLCLQHYTKSAVQDFSLCLDDTILADPEARFLGYVSAVEVPTKGDPLDTVPEEFRQFLSIMGKEAADALPQHTTYDMKIDLKEGTTAPWGPIYPLSEAELEVLREYLKEMVRTGKIRHSTSSAGSPILFVPKPNGRGLRLCVDYRGINKVTIPNRYPLPLMQELQDQVQGAQWFTKMNLKSGFHLIRIREGDEWKTAFRTRYGQYEYMIMPFRLTNAPSTFQDMMNHNFRDMIDLGLLAYMDDLLIYADTVERHDEIVQEVLRRLTKNRLAISPEKCVWRTQEVKFLGYIINKDGIKCPRKKLKRYSAGSTPLR
jgi:hypothetical protein